MVMHWLPPALTLCLQEGKVIEKAPKSTPPVLRFQPHDDASPLRRFTALDDQSLLVLGPRRVTPVQCPQPNTSSDLVVCTSVGFCKLPIPDYSAAVRQLRPDIFIAAADIPFGATAPPARRRAQAMIDRTTDWVHGQIKAHATDASPSRAALFAPVLPVPVAAQHRYLESLAETHESIHGLAIYDPTTVSDLPASLLKLPKLALTTPATPQQILHEIEHGIDLFTVPFLAAATDAGIALDFRFPVAARDVDAPLPLPLGTDMWADEHSVDLSPLSAGCGCYACATHHRAYLRHLLAAKEMLGWTLLQLHNHRVMADFFAGVRRSVEAGTFARDRRAFEATYEATLPERTGQGPRVRGYQYRSEKAGETKRNAAPFTSLDDRAGTLAEARADDPVLDVEDIAAAGLAEKV